MSIVGAALVGLGLDVLFGKLDGPAAQWANLADTAARETLGLQFGPGGLAGFRSLRFRSPADLSVPSPAFGIILSARAGHGRTGIVGGCFFTDKAKACQKYFQKKAAVPLTSSSP